MTDMSVQPIAPVQRRIRKRFSTVWVKVMPNAEFVQIYADTNEAPCACLAESYFIKNNCVEVKVLRPNGQIATDSSRELVWKRNL